MEKYSIYGFEDYKVFDFNNFFNLTSFTSWSIHGYKLNHHALIDNGEYNIKYNVYKDLDVPIRDNKELLDTAKNVYVHPCVEMARSMLSKKYKKCLNPWLADVVVIPDYQNPPNMPQVTNYAVFINEDDKTVFITDGIHKDDTALIEKLQEGKKIRDILTPSQVSDIVANCPANLCYYNGVYRRDSLLDSEFEFYGPIVMFNDSDLYIRDYITKEIPESKVVYESSIFRTLNDETNTITYDNLFSIYEMLMSNDKDAIGSALKALAAMDYINYPISVKYVLVSSSDNWWYNKATNTTNVKYMFKTLTGNSPRGGIRFNDTTIDKKDFELLDNISKAINKNENNRISFLRSALFTYEDEDYNIYPRIKK